ncbi:unnamed protein product [Notodromas monacha]|uniref:V-type proton ATPase subunit E n=1 Tax=Notodromas monacha TaxID=399045 RepID=A0A7R9BUK6_9CRUS|nr:unnamed protein product [Notodromas monacha]CAG0920995.1 unnamed protein product [Notodromas monacha]
MALSDVDVQKQIKHMMAFIEQEATEKAEEVDAKAEEEFNVEKGRLVQSQRVKIMEYFDRKEKQVEMQKKIQASNMLNQARLKVLKEQEEKLDKLIDETRRRLTTVTKSADKYAKLLQLLIAQGVFQLLEPHLVVRCRKEDLHLVRDAVKGALEHYTNITDRRCEIKIDEENFLSPQVAGGVEMLIPNSKIKIVNTLESRLAMITSQLLPEIRVRLFGRNPGRKFLD